MDRLEFYKEQYYKEIERKNDVTNSLSTPIGIISALVAGLFYSLTTFDYSLYTSLTIIFLLVFCGAITFLSISVFHLMKAFSDLHNGFSYAYLIDTDDLDNYYQKLKSYYEQVNTTDNSDKDLKEYVLNELIKCTGVNQKNNKSKIYHRFLCHKHMIFSFLMMCGLTLPFGINYGLHDSNPKIQKIEIDSTLNINLQSKQNQIFIDSLIKTAKIMASEKENKLEKPTPPPTQIIKEGKDPKIKEQTFGEQEKARKKDK
jgi:hypothetical protein